MNRKRKLAAGIILVASLCSFGGFEVATGLSASGQDPYGAWAPNINQLAAARSLPVVAASTALASAVDRSSSATGGDPATALNTLRRLASNLGSSRASIYVYAPTGGAVCVLLWQRQGECPTASASDTPSVEAFLSPGGAGYVDAPADVAPAVVGVVSDAVQSVALTEGGATTPLPINNNSFFAELNEPDNAAFSVALRINYADGSTRTLTLNQPGPIPGTGPRG